MHPSVIIPAEIGRPGFTRLFGLLHEQVVKVDGPFDVDLPKVTPCFATVLCSVCGDTVAENYARVENSLAVCADCCNYTR